MQDRPTRLELLQGVEYFLTDEAIERLEGSAKFKARVAANAVRMVMRELEGEQEDVRQEFESLKELIFHAAEPKREFAELREQVDEMNTELARLIRDGKAEEPEFRRRLIDHLKPVAYRKLAVNNPKMAAMVKEEYGL